jgi:hypothetical protein
MDLSIGWAYAEVIVGGELGDYVDGCIGGGALLREELLERLLCTSRSLRPIHHILLR